MKKRMKKQKVAAAAQATFVFTNKKLNAMIPSSTAASAAAVATFDANNRLSFQTRSNYQQHSAATNSDLTSLSHLAHSAAPPPIPAVPASSAYRGDYGFEVSYQQQSKDTKSATWTYSEVLKKLYVRMAHTCPVRFKTASSPPPGSVIRAMPVYIKPEHVQEVVKRCPNHASNPQYNENRQAPPQHLLVCEHKRARYDDDPYTGRLSVVIPHEPPQAGTEWVTNLFQFMCFSSCVGGLTRRPIQVIFTLEHSGLVLGRQAVEIRICACPGRDRRNEEKMLLQTELKRSGTICMTGGRKERGNTGKKSATAAAATRRRKARNGQDCDEDEDEDDDDNDDDEDGDDIAGGGGRNSYRDSADVRVGGVGAAIKRRRTDDSETYSLTVRGKQNYEILRVLRDSLELASLLSPSERLKLQRQSAAVHTQLTSPIPSHVMPGTPASSNRYSFLEVDGFPSPFSSDLFGFDSVPSSLSPHKIVEMTHMGTFMSTTNIGPSSSFTADGLHHNHPTAVLAGKLHGSAAMDLQQSSMSSAIAAAAAGCSAESSNNTDNEVTSSCITNSMVSELQGSTDDQDIDSWLTRLDLAVYTDDFHQLGLKYMNQLDGFSFQDLQALKICTQHVYKIWRSLVEYRNNVNSTDVNVNINRHLIYQSPTGNDSPSQVDYSSHQSAAATSDDGSVAGGAGGGIGLETEEHAGLNTLSASGRVYDVMRYTYKPKVLLKEEDHNYC